MIKAYQQSVYPKYNRLKKKFPSLFRNKVNKAEDEVASNPFVGEEKTGELKGIWVYKFKIFDQLILLAYQVNKGNKEIIFAAVGGHKNFYKDLKQYLKR